MQFADSPQLQKELQKQEELLKSWGAVPPWRSGRGKLLGRGVSAGEVPLQEA